MLQVSSINRVFGTTVRKSHVKMFAVAYSLQESYSLSIMLLLLQPALAFTNKQIQELNAWNSVMRRLVTVSMNLLKQSFWGWKT